MTKAVNPDVKEKAPVEAAAEKKAPVKKAAEKAEKKPVKAAPKAEDAVYIQFGEGEWEISQLAAQANAAYVAEGHRASSIKSFRLYVKPEERKAYYVVNDKSTGSIEF